MVFFCNLLHLKLGALLVTVYFVECDVPSWGSSSLSSEVPILFELRKSIIYDGILAMEWGPESEELVNLSSYEAQLQAVEL